MGSIGTWWVKGVPALEGEETRDGFYANRLRGEKRPIGGKLYVTNERVIFAPHRIDSLLGGAVREVTLVDVEAVDMADDSIPGGDSGLAIQLADGTVERFIVNDREGALAAIESERD